MIRFWSFSPSPLRGLTPQPQRDIFHHSWGVNLKFGLYSVVWGSLHCLLWVVLFTEAYPNSGISLTTLTLLDAVFWAATRVERAPDLSPWPQTPSLITCTWKFPWCGYRSTEEAWQEFIERLTNLTHVFDVAPVWKAMPGVWLNIHAAAKAGGQSFECKLSPEIVPIVLMWPHQCGSVSTEEPSIIGLTSSAAPSPRKTSCQTWKGGGRSA